MNSFHPDPDPDPDPDKPDPDNPHPDSGNPHPGDPDNPANSLLSLSLLLFPFKCSNPTKITNWSYTLYNIFRTPNNE